MGWHFVQRCFGGGNWTVDAAVVAVLFGVCCGGSERMTREAWRGDGDGAVQRVKWRAPRAGRGMLWQCIVELLTGRAQTRGG